jgi:hypothetical protein
VCRGTKSAVLAHGPRHADAPAQRGFLEHYLNDIDDGDDSEEDADVHTRSREMKGHAAAAAEAARLLHQMDRLQNELQTVDESLPDM